MKVLIYVPSATSSINERISYSSARACSIESEQRKFPRYHFSLDGIDAKWQARGANYFILLLE